MVVFSLGLREKSKNNSITIPKIGENYSCSRSGRTTEINKILNNCVIINGQILIFVYKQFIYQTKTF